MPRYRYRPNLVEAMYFDGTPNSAREVIGWLAEVAPELTIRQRVEYKGWEDPTGHVELEIRDHEDQSTAGDWIIVELETNPHRVRLLNERNFQRRFQPDP